MKHRFKTIDGAVRRIREQEKMIEAMNELLNNFDAQRKVLAMLAADGPCFFNPLAIVDGKATRDDVLKEMGLHPDGSFISKRTT